MHRLRHLLATALVVLFAQTAAAQVTIPYTFVFDTTIDEAQVNSNFTALGNAALNRTGGTVTGDLASSGGSLSGTWTGGPILSGAIQLSGAATATGSITFDSDALHIFDTNASHDLVITAGSDLTADRIFTLTTGDAARTLTLSADVTLDQGVATTSAVTFATVDTGQGANELYAMDQGVATTSAVTFATVDTGQGANELYAMDQAVQTTDDPTFDTMTLDEGQLIFPGAQNASAGVNTFDDYEEGTWTPVIGGTGGESGQAYLYQVGYYRKFGSWVEVEFYVNLSTEGTITGNVQIEGLPFAAASYTATGPPQPMGWHLTPTSFVNVFGVISGSTFQINGITGATTSYQFALTAADISNSTGLTGVLSYRSAN